MTVLAGLALAAYGGQAALAKSADRLPQAHTPEVVRTSGADLVAQDAAGQKPEIKLPALPAPAEDRSGALSEAQPADDKGGVNPGAEIVGAEAGDDNGIIQAEPGDDNGMGEVELGDDRGMGEAELGDDKGMGEAELGDDKGMGEAEAGRDKGLNEVEDNAAGVEFRGTLSAINGNVLTINGMTVTISATTEIKGTLKVGDMVKVEGFRATDNTVQAQEIKIVSQTSDDSLNSKPAATSTEDKSR